MIHSRTLLITGARHVGKSTVLRKVTAALQAEGLRISGLLTERTGAHDLSVTELHTGASYPLTAPFQASSTSPTRHFTMSEDAMAQSSQALAAGFPTQIFILDEIGPLELVHRRGWAYALELLRCESYDLAIVVVRPELLGAAIAELPGAWFTVIQVTQDNRQCLPDDLHEVILAAVSGKSPGEKDLL